MREITKVLLALPVLVAALQSSNVVRAQDGSGSAQGAAPEFTGVPDRERLTLDEIHQLLDGMDRPEADRARDPYRLPAEVLALAGIHSGDVVVDLYPGAEAYYSRILAGVVGPSGRIYGITPPFVTEKVPDAIKGPEALDVSTPNFTSLTVDFPELNLPEPADVIWMVNIYHDAPLMKYDKQVMNKHFYSLLKPGGTLLVIDHHAQEGTGERDSQTLHRSDAEMTLRELKAAGFRLEKSSEILANPDDDRTKSVFDPSIRGQTDRYLYVFRK